MQPVLEYFSGITTKAFVAQFVSSISVGEREEHAIQIKFFLIPASSRSEAYTAAQTIAEILSERYRNREGEIVTVNCEGIYSVDELEYADSDGALELGLFQFSRATRLEHLLQKDREDLPLLDC